MNTLYARWVAGILGLVLLGGLIVWWNSGYGKISEQSYDYALALISACNRQDESRVQKIAKEIGQRQLPEYDRRVIQQIVDTAMNDDWELAAARTRLLLKAQVETVK